MTPLVSGFIPVTTTLEKASVGSGVWGRRWWEVVTVVECGWGVARLGGRVRGGPASWAVRQNSPTAPQRGHASSPDAFPPSLCGMEAREEGDQLVHLLVLRRNTQTPVRLGVGCGAGWLAEQVCGKMDRREVLYNSKAYYIL